MKTEEWDEKMKLSNQYRGLDTEEYGFLAARAREQREKERQVADEESRGIASYREYVDQGGALWVPLTKLQSIGRQARRGECSCRRGILQTSTAERAERAKGADEGGQEGRQVVAERRCREEEAEARGKQGRGGQGERDQDDRQARG
jgi:hypothetical protein